MIVNQMFVLEYLVAYYHEDHFKDVINETTIHSDLLSALEELKSDEFIDVADKVLDSFFVRIDVIPVLLDENAESVDSELPPIISRCVSFINKATGFEIIENKYF